VRGWPSAPTTTCACRRGAALVCCGSLDLWLEAGELWLKDADELEAGLAVGKYAPQQAATIRDIAEQARHDLVEPNAWPLDEGWEDWQPPAEWDVPLTLPDDVVEISSDRST
jgi:hypothetical protein